MKILFLSAQYPPAVRGGGEVSTHILASALVALGHEVDVVTEAHDTIVDDTQEIDGVHVRRVAAPLTAKPLFERRHSRSLAKRLAREVQNLADYDVVHAHDFRSTLVVYELLQQGVLAAEHVFVTARDYAQICGSPNNLSADDTPCEDCARLRCIVKNRAVIEAPLWRRPFRIWQYWYNIGYRRRAFAAMPRQVFISHAQQSVVEAIQRAGSQQRQVIYNPTDPAYLSARPQASRGSLILFIGRVQHYKGVELLLQAFREVVQRHPDAELRIIGDGPDRDRYESLVAGWGLQYKVSFSTHVAHHRLQSVYDEARVVVAPHIWDEPFGRVVIEAMTRARVIVAAVAGGPGELIEDGVTGLLFARGDVDDLVRQLSSAITMSDGSRQRIEKNARIWVQENIEPRLVAKQYERLYSEVVANNS